MDRIIKLLIAGAAIGTGVCVIRSLAARRLNCNVAKEPEDKDVPHSMEPVEAASEDSFPASDPPSWTGTTGPIAPEQAL